MKALVPPRGNFSNLSLRGVVVFNFCLNFFFHSNIVDTNIPLVSGIQHSGSISLYVMRGSSQM